MELFAEDWNESQFWVCFFLFFFFGWLVGWLVLEEG
jgi:hypothetical protein